MTLFSIILLLLLLLLDDLYHPNWFIINNTLVVNKSGIIAIKKHFIVELVHLLVVRAIGSCHIKPSSAFLWLSMCGFSSNIQKQIVLSLYNWLLNFLITKVVLPKVITAFVVGHTLTLL